MPKRKAKRRPAANPATPGRKTAPGVVQTQAPRRDWRRTVLIAGSVVAVGAFVFFLASGVANERSGVPEGVTTVAVGEPRHVEGEIEYDGHPAGGEHSSVWLNCGVYDAPVPEENAVHSLEHGAVWITYPLGDETVDIGRLNGYAGRNKIIVSPVIDQTSPVLVTAWANQMESSDAGDPRISQFIVEFAGAASAPEPGGLCSGGIGQPG